MTPSTTCETGGPVVDWNIYSGQWAPIRVIDFPSASNKSLALSDQDPYDYARALRVFPKTKQATLSFLLKVCPKQNKNGRLEIDVADRFGNRPVRRGLCRRRKDPRDQAVLQSHRTLPTTNRSIGTH